VLSESALSERGKDMKGIKNIKKNGTNEDDTNEIIPVESEHDFRVVEIFRASFVGAEYSLDRPSDYISPEIKLNTRVL
jgi:hypothetical protein